MSFLTKLFGDPNAKIVKEIQPIVDRINGLEDTVGSLSDEALKAKTTEFKEALAGGKTLDDILPEAFAVVREAAKRTLGMRHYDVQMIGGIVLHRGQIAEMRTGEGKTLVATLPTYLNALAGKGVHVITVNDYLAKRDAVWMGQIYDFLGLSTGIIQNQRVSYIYDASFKGGKEGEDEDALRDEIGSFKVEEAFLRPVSRQEAYRADITYGTNNEYGFDYLRDNMVQHLGDMVMRPGSEMVYAIIDEVDSILIDEARTPLIISAPAEEATDQYYRFAGLVRQLVPEDYVVDEKQRAVSLNEQGITKFEGWLGVQNLYAEGGIRLVHHIEQALKAEILFHLDKEYVVDGPEIVIVDEFTGRKMPGRRYSEGLHQAIEAKENLPIQRESQTLATITFQNLFRMYGKLSGMTGTAVTEAEEFAKIYKLDVVVIPTNKIDRRTDHSDRIYKTEEGKYKAILEKVRDCQNREQPVLIGTASVEKNEKLSRYLTEHSIVHQVLNAKNHEREGEIIAQAGRPGVVTLATNMAGRGVDIKLGGVPNSPEEQAIVEKAGGLFVLGTERHESRRIDNQLRGRAARQGDPGETQFYLSTEDDLMRIFAGDRMKAVMTRLNVPDDMPIEQPMITKILESAQKKVESHHFDMRKHLLEYDDVLNKHRTLVYRRRKKILELAAGVTLTETAITRSIEDEKDEERKDEPETLPPTLKDTILDYIEKEVAVVVGLHTNMEDQTDWEIQKIIEAVNLLYPLTQTQQEKLKQYTHGEQKMDDVMAREAMITELMAIAKSRYEEAETKLLEVAKTNEAMRDIEKGVLIRAIDALWVDHLVSIDHIRTGIGLQGYGQRDPLIEYKKETYHLFQNLLVNIQRDVAMSFFRVHATVTVLPTIMATDAMTSPEAATKPQEAVKPPGGSIGRNDPCYCGSGKKYKKCHGA